MKQIKDSLTLAGEIVSNLDMVVSMMNDLGPAYTPLVTTISTKSDKS